MPAFYHIDKQKRLVLSTASGVLSREDLRNHMERLMKDPDFDPQFSQLADFTHLTKIDFTAEDVRQLAQSTAFGADARRAFIVGDDASEELAEMFALLRKIAGDRGIRVFRTLEEGIDWILPRVSPR